MAEISAEFEIDKKSEIGERLDHPESVCLAGGTLMKTWKAENGDRKNPDQVRGDLAIESIKKAIERGFRVVVIDGGSSEDFIKKLGQVSTEVKTESKSEGIKIHDLIVEPESDKGYSGSRRQALKRAEELRQEGVKAIIMMEIEKQGITENAEKLVKPILEGVADVVIPERGIKVNLNKENTRVQEQNEDFRGYPPYQAYSEMWANKMLNRLLVSAKLMRADEPVLDLFGGTRVIANKPEILEDFYQRHEVVSGEVKTDPQMYFDAVYAPIAYLLLKDRRVLSVPIEYHHPAEQTAVEAGAVNFDEKRDSQRNMITTEMAKQTRFLGELKRYLKLEMRRFPYEMESGFGIVGVSEMAKKEIVGKEYLAEEPLINSSFEDLKEKRLEGISGEKLVEYEGRTILESLLDQKFKLCNLNGEDISESEVLDEKIKNFVGAENSVFIIRKAMSEVDIKKEGVEVCSWGGIFNEQGKWVMTVDEGAELDSASLMVNDIFEDYQIKINIMVRPQRSMRQGETGLGLFARIFRHS